MEVYEYGRIQKFETPTLIKGANVILGKYDTEALDIKTWCDLLLDQESELSEVTEVNRKHPAMDELKIYRKERKTLLGVIKIQSFALERSRIGSIITQQKVVLDFLNRFIGDISANNYKKVDEKVSEIINAIEKDSSLQSAIAAVGMKVYFDELKVVQQKITSSQSIVVKFKSELPKTKIPTIKKSAVKALNNLIVSIELGKIKHPELDYEPLINELNAFLGQYQSLDKTRRTISKKAAENKKTVASSTTTTATVL